MNRISQNRFLYRIFIRLAPPDATTVTQEYFHTSPGPLTKRKISNRLINCMANVLIVIYLKSSNAEFIQSAPIVVKRILLEDMIIIVL